MSTGQQAMRVTFHMEGPWVESDRPIHLDDVLAAMRVIKEQEAQGEGFDPALYNHDLPLARYEGPNGQWVFKASMLIAGDRMSQQTWMQTGRLDLEKAAEHRATGYLDLRANKIITAGGPFKTAMYHLPITYSTHLYGYAVGDIEAVRELLERCHSIGPRRAAGFGSVRSIEVQPVEALECYWSHRNMPLPADGSAPNGHVTIQSALVPPYWKRELHTQVSTPLNRNKEQHVVG